MPRHSGARAHPVRCPQRQEAVQFSAGACGLLINQWKARVSLSSFFPSLLLVHKNQILESTSHLPPFSISLTRPLDLHGELRTPVQGYPWGGLGRSTRCSGLRILDQNGADLLVIAFGSLGILFSFAILLLLNFQGDGRCWKVLA